MGASENGRALPAARRTPSFRAVSCGPARTTSRLASTLYARSRSALPRAALAFAGVGCMAVLAIWV